MKIKKEVIVLGVVIVLLSMYLIFKSNDRSLYELPELKPVSASKISKITLDSSKGSVVLTRKAGEWVVNEEGYPGDDSGIKRVSDIVANLTLTTLISESKNYDRYDLGPEDAITIKAWEGDKLVREFDVGKAASSHRHTFVRLAGDQRVYHAQENFRSRVEGNADTFRSKTVLSFETDQVEEVHISKQDAQGVYTREKNSKTGSEKTSDGDATEMKAADPIWRNAAGDIVEKDKITKLIDDFSSLKCRAFIYDRKKSDFTKPIAGAAFKGAETYTLQIFEQLEKDASEYPAVSSQNDYPFLLPKWQADQILNALVDIAPFEKENAAAGEGQESS
jgi:hypothetical protein